MELLAIPLMMLNFFSGILGGIWLAFLGEWHVIVVGLVLSIGGGFIVSLLLAPSMIFLTPILVNEKLANSVALMVPLCLLSVGYTYCVMGVWAIGVFWYFSQSVGYDAIYPVILWSYATATAVWSYMAQKEAQSGGGVQAVMSSFFNQIGCVSLMIYTFYNFQRLDVYEMAIWFGVPMVISLIAQVIMMVSAMKAERRIPNS